MTREDIECIIKWFSHIEQLATDGKTANGFQTSIEKLLPTIKVIAKDSREYVEKFCNESVPNDLEEAAHSYSESDEPLYSPGHRFHWDDDALFGKQIEASFIAGAKWQKEQMMKEAVEGKIEEVSFNNGELHNTIFFSFDEESLHVENRIWFPRCGKEGDKVRIIIVKED